MSLLYEYKTLIYIISIAVAAISGVLLAIELLEDD